MADNTPLVSVQDLKKSYSGRVLFQNLNFGIFEKEKMGMIGPNGAGKSTLLKILAGQVEADSGQRAQQKRALIAFVEQDPVFGEEQSVGEYLHELLQESKVSADDQPAAIAQAANLLNLELPTKIKTLSGGWQKRLSIIAQLSRQPDLVFLDEPTNHLDFSGIRWLEKLLKNFNGAFLMISHDRSFLENVCNRVMELNPRYEHGYFSCAGNYSFFLQKRTDHFIALQQYEQSLANKVGREIEWLRQGVKARTTKSKSRAQAALSLQSELSDVKSRNAQRTTAIEFKASSKNLKNLLVCDKIDLSYEGTPVLKKVSLHLKSGDRISLVGDNGSGKSTLLKIMAGEIKPDSGDIQIGHGAKVTYFDQKRASLDEDLSIKEFLSDEGDMVYYLGRPIHVASYARRFLFTNDVLNFPIRRLSGGEKARLLIAKLMLNESDILLLDEPTNDLDIETMDAFAESLMEFPGAIVLVSHDRFFVDQICDDILVINKGERSERFADLRQWEAHVARQETPTTKEDKPKKPRVKIKKRLSYNEKREFEQMEEKILVAEEALERWRGEVENPSTASSPDKLKEAFQKMSEAQSIVDELYERWAELEEKQGEA